MKSFTLTRTNRNTGLVIKAVCLQLEEDTFILQKGSIISPFELKGLSKRMKEMRSNAKKLISGREDNILPGIITCSLVRSTPYQGICLY